MLESGALGRVDLVPLAPGQVQYSHFSTYYLSLSNTISLFMQLNAAQREDGGSVERRKWGVREERERGGREEKRDERESRREKEKEQRVEETRDRTERR